MHPDKDDFLRILLVAGSAALGAVLVSRYTAFSTNTTTGTLAVALGGGLLASTTAANMTTTWNPWDLTALSMPNIMDTSMRTVVYAAALWLSGATGDMEIASTVGITCAAGQMLF